MENLDSAGELCLPLGRVAPFLSPQLTSTQAYSLFPGRQEVLVDTASQNKRHMRWQVSDSVTTEMYPEVETECRDRIFEEPNRYLFHS